MESIDRKVLYDENGQPVRVLISFEDWVKIERQLGLEDAPNGDALMAFAGLNLFPGEALDVQKAMRSEWHG